MHPLTLAYPVCTLSGELLMDKGDVVTPDTVYELVARKPARNVPYEPFLGRTSVLEDMRQVLSELPNPRILPDRQDVDDLLCTMHAAVLPAPILELLISFKETDFYTYRHILVVFALTALLARDVLEDYPERIGETAAGPVHDIGNACVPLAIRRKRTSLTKGEQTILQHHTIAGYLLLAYYSGGVHHIEARFEQLRAVRDHHERCNSTGYPRGMALEDPVVEIIAVCDVYDALVSDRPFRPAAYDNRTALEELTAMAQRGELREDAVRALIAFNRDTKPDYHEVTLSCERRGRPPEENQYGVLDESSEDLQSGSVTDGMGPDTE